jgi:tRNA(Ile)-lysidine synthase
MTIQRSQRFHRFAIAVRDAIRRDHLLPERGVVVVACSGGADSLALLHALHILCNGNRAAFPHVTLHVAHLDHGLRAESPADAAFVRDIAAAWDIPCTIGAITEAERATWRGSAPENGAGTDTGPSHGLRGGTEPLGPVPEAAARAARYRFLREVAQSAGADRIALGHTADDQAETVLMHVIRGSGLDGLVGMRPRTGDLMRPLLGLWRADTVAYCAAMGLEPRQDATNADMHYLRNRVRHELLPLLETYQAQIRATLARNAPLIAQDLDFIEAEVARVWPDAVIAQSPADVKLNRSALRVLHPALRYRVLRRAILAAGSDKPDAHLNADSLRRLDRVIMDHSGGLRRIELSTGVVARCDGSVVYIELVAKQIGADS